VYIIYCAGQPGNGKFAAPALFGRLKTNMGPGGIEKISGKSACGKNPLHTIAYLAILFNNAWDTA
jgi:hypothetical protein